MSYMLLIFDKNMLLSDRKVFCTIFKKGNPTESMILLVLRFFLKECISISLLRPSCQKMRKKQMVAIYSDFLSYQPTYRVYKSG